MKNQKQRGFDSRYKKWREAVLRKCGKKCVRCGNLKRLHADHIKPWADYPALRYCVKNGQILCFDCHVSKHPFMIRYYPAKRKISANKKTGFRKTKKQWHFEKAMNKAKSFSVKRYKEFKPSGRNVVIGKIMKGRSMEQTNLGYIKNLST